MSLSNEKNEQLNELQNLNNIPIIISNDSLTYNTVDNYTCDIGNISDNDINVTVITDTTNMTETEITEDRITDKNTIDEVDVNDIKIDNTFNDRNNDMNNILFMSLTLMRIFQKLLMMTNLYLPDVLLHLVVVPGLRETMNRWSWRRIR